MAIFFLNKLLKVNLHNYFNVKIDHTFINNQIYIS